LRDLRQVGLGKRPKKVKQGLKNTWVVDYCGVLAKTLVKKRAELFPNLSSEITKPK
jgi:hypothetical protein